MKRREFIQYGMLGSATFLSANFKAIDTKKFNKYYYFAEEYVDLVEFCKIITQQSEADPKKCNDVIECLNNSMIHMVNPLDRHENVFGLGLFLPFKRKQIDKYRYLPIY